MALVRRLPIITLLARAFRRRATPESIGYRRYIGPAGQLLSRTVALPGVAILLLAGCSSPLPKPLQTAPANEPPFHAVAEHPERYLGQRVRWGGVIIRVDNQADGSLIEILAKPLDASGRPREAPPAQGRFLARTKRFIDPLVYKSDREITVAGNVAGSVTRPVGDYPYRYPLLDAEVWHLWAPRPVYRDPPPYWYDPWYPWGYPYPWWYRHPFHD
ncbi:MAG: hypothetical protein Kow006_11180 [Gammaproteobacteria bacterium]